MTTETCDNNENNETQWIKVKTTMFDEISKWNYECRKEFNEMSRWTKNIEMGDSTLCFQQGW